TRCRRRNPSASGEGWTRRSAVRSSRTAGSTPSWWGPSRSTYGGLRKAQTARTTERQNMLALTDAAAEASSALAAQEAGAGLRCAGQHQRQAEAQLALSVAGAPEQEDQVLGTEGGAGVFLDTQASTFLDDKVLDVQQDDEGQLNFAVMQQPEGEEQGQEQ